MENRIFLMNLFPSMTFIEAMGADDVSFPALETAASASSLINFQLVNTPLEPSNKKTGH